MGHAHDHDHDHHGGHGHSHGPPRMGRAFAIGVVLNLGIVVVEIVFGIMAKSMALLADSGHNLGDVLGLVLAGGAAALARRRPTKRHTYGFRRATLLSALANALVLLFATGGVAWESVRRLRSPEAADARIVMIVALVGMVVNGLSAALFFREREKDLNVRAAFLHLAGDAAIALGVVVAGLVILETGWAWVDPVTALVVSVLILVSTWSLLRQSTALVLDAVPEGVDIDAVRAYLAKLPRVVEVHDLHVWAMSTTETALTAHLVMPAHLPAPTFLSDVCTALHEKFGIHHATLQVDPEEAPAPCKLAPDETV